MNENQTVPSPLGWCSWCLGDDEVRSQAVTTFSGTALCETCNRSANENENAVGADIAQRTEQLDETFRRLGRPVL